VIALHITEAFSEVNKNIPLKLKNYLVSLGTFASENIFFPYREQDARVTEIKNQGGKNHEYRQAKRYLPFGP
jgi:hypothetical protein